MLKPDGKEIREIIDVKLKDLLQPEAYGKGIEYFKMWGVSKKIEFLKINK